MERRFPLVLVVAGFLVAACDSNGTKIAVGGTSMPVTSLMGPTSGPTGATVTPLPLPLTHVPLVGFGCPSVQPFSTNFALHFAVVPADTFLNQVSFQFIDGSGISGSPLLMSSADMNARFGNTLIPAGTSRDFAFQPQFGCGLSQPVRVVLTAVFSDRYGTPQQTTLTLPFE